MWGACGGVCMSKVAEWEQGEGKGGGGVRGRQAWHGGRRTRALWGESDPPPPVLLRNPNHTQTGVLAPPRTAGPQTRV